MSDLTGELLSNIVAASPERKTAALKALRGEAAPAVQALAGPLFFNMGGAAKYLGIGRSSLWRLVQAGRVPTVELMPGMIRVRRADLDQLAAGGES